MNITQQAWGWLVAGVLAAGLNASYHDGGLEWAHQVADRVQDRAEMVLDRASEAGDRIAAQVQMITARNETASCRLSSAVARLQSSFDRTVAAQSRIAQTEVDRSQEEVNRWQALSDREQARRQAQLDRLEAVRERMQVRIAQQAAHIRIATFAPISVQSGSRGVSAGSGERSAYADDQDAGHARDSRRDLRRPGLSGEAESFSWSCLPGEDRR